jgi:hypothetical protein
VLLQVKAATSFLEYSPRQQKVVPERKSTSSPSRFETPTREPSRLIGAFHANLHGPVLQGVHKQDKSEIQVAGLDRGDPLSHRLDNSRSCRTDPVGEEDILRKLLEVAWDDPLGLVAGWCRDAVDGANPFCLAEPWVGKGTCHEVHNDQRFQGTLARA